ncbi:MAG: 50S ribosomal protein L4 [Acidimicrobiales bacterium]|nr:50S ribosomal protein L4 [Acidimicrobiales bacterium]
MAADQLPDATDAVRLGPIAPRRSSSGEDLGTVALSPEIFGIVPHVAVMHQVVTAQLAAARAGTHNTLTRAEVRGGGHKPYRQKGTGRARQGSTRAPQFVGGGVAAGPKPRSYRQRTPKKMIALALRSALSDRAAEERVVVVDRFSYEVPKTKQALATLTAVRPEGADAGDRVLVVVDQDDEVAQRSFANLPEAHVLPAGELNCYDVLRSDWVLFTDATVPGGATVVAGPSTPEAPEAEAAEEPAEAEAAEEPAEAEAAEAEAPEDADPGDAAPGEEPD